MITLACKIPRKIVVACSGGPDSLALLHFCVRGKKDVTALYVNHGSEHAKEAQACVEKYCAEHKVKLEIRNVDASVEHTELAWREARLLFYKEFTSQGVYVLSGHHISDAFETLLMGLLHGQIRTMKPVDEEFKLLKPFLYAEKKDLIAWCNRWGLSYVTDPTNLSDDGNSRSIIRKNIEPFLSKIHPGYLTSIKRALQKDKL